MLVFDELHKFPRWKNWIKGIYDTAPEALRRLMTVGGFPEPFLDNDETEARRWRKERYDRILKDDVRDLEPLKDIQTLSLFVDQLRRRVSSPIVLSNLANELQVAPQTLKHWLEVLERMYLVFVVRPYTKSLPRAVQKPPKSISSIMPTSLVTRARDLRISWQHTFSNVFSFRKIRPAIGMSSVTSKTKKAAKWISVL